MPRHAPLTEHRMDVGTRIIERVRGSYRVTIPPPAITLAQLRPGDELRVGVTDDGEVAFFPEGVPFTEDTARYAGNAALFDNNGSLKVTILADAADDAGVAAGDTAAFAVEQSVIYLDVR